MKFIGNMRNVLIMTMLLASVSIYAQDTLQSRIEALAGDDTFSQSVVGICARTADGKTLVDINSGMMMLPASNMKLVSTGAALHALGSDWQFETSIGYD
jgi:D-alanyl-D-alanine carboxypeptidase/D-alanyl-D-alanine-endopeptidase (penicillin-binding protein 4)